MQSPNTFSSSNIPDFTSSIVLNVFNLWMLPFCLWITGNSMTMIHWCFRLVFIYFSYHKHDEMLIAYVAINREHALMSGVFRDCWPALNILHSGIVLSSSSTQSQQHTIASKIQSNPNSLEQSKNLTWNAKVRPEFQAYHWIPSLIDCWHHL